jgi:hypothetical protein
VTVLGDVIKCLSRSTTSTVFRLAAHTPVDLSFGNSYIFTKNNVVGTHVLLESIKKYGKVRRLHHIPTDDVCLIHEEYLPGIKHGVPADDISTILMPRRGETKVRQPPSSRQTAAPPRRRSTLAPLPLRKRRGRSLRHYSAQGRHRRNLQRRLARQSLQNSGCPPKNRSAYLAQLNSAAWILHTRDGKFNDQQYAVNGSKLHALGC